MDNNDRAGFPADDDFPLACGCPNDTPEIQVSECDVQCTGCGLVTA